MPCPYQERLVFANESLNPPQFRARKATASLQARWIQPELGLGFSPLHVNMGRFVSIRRVEEEPVWHRTEELSATLPVYMLSESQRGQLRRRRGLSWGFTCRVYLDDSRRQRVAGYIGGDERAFGNLPHEPELFDPSGAGFRRAG